MQSVLSIFTNPVKTFNHLKSADKFSTVAFVILLALTAVNLSLDAPQSLNAGMAKFLLFVIGIFLNAISLCLIARAAKVKIAFGKATNLIIYCFIVMALGNLFNIILQNLFGIEIIANPYDTQKIGMHLILNDDIPFYTFLSYFNPFHIWYAALMIWELKIFAGQKWAKAFVVGIIHWLVIVIIPIAVTYVTQR